MKICKTCGRTTEMRKKWEQIWDQILYCSAQCRQNKKAEKFEEKILQLLKLRGADKTICPYEVLSEPDKKDKKIMEAVRASARRLVATGHIEIWQRGKRVDPSTAKGPIRLKLLRKG